MCRRLEILYMSNNNIKSWAEIDKLRDLPKIDKVLFTGNPIYSPDHKSKIGAGDQGPVMGPLLEVLRRVDTLGEIDGELITESIKLLL